MLYASFFFFKEKQEYWWVYISDRKSHTLLTSPYHVTSLVDTEEVQLRFTAPRWTGMYTFHVCLRSDSYLGFDQMQEIKVGYCEIILHFENLWLYVNTFYILFNFSLM